MANALQPPNSSNQYYQARLELLVDSYQDLLNRPLIQIDTSLNLGQQLWEADFALLSHNADADPLFNYGNRMALQAFELSWQELIGMPSRFSAEPVHRQEREQLLAKVERQGFIDDYCGVRIAKSGKRFLIRQAVVWNVYDKQQNYYGQAACFKDWSLLP